MTETVSVAARFCGPPGTGNGGYVAGRAAQALGGPVVEVTLLAPAPLDTPLTIVRDGAALTLRHGELDVVRAQPGALETPAAAPPNLADAAAAAARSPWAGPDRPFPGCFVCGPARPEGDGLRIFPAPAGGPDDGVLAAWTPSADLASADLAGADLAGADDARVESAFLWAALDCPSYFALPGAGRMIALLGRMTARVVARPPVGEPLAVAAWRTASEGRKHAAVSALYDRHGALVAHASCLWIALKDQTAAA